MTTWETIFGVPAPVRGRVSEFDGACGEFEARHTAARNIVDQFDRISSAGVAGRLEGEVGEVFHQVAQEVAEGLQDLPRVSLAAYNALSSHREQLRALRTEVDEALGRARLAWTTRNTLYDERPGLEERVRNLRRQIDGADPGQDTSNLEQSLRVAEGRVTTNQDNIDAETGNLEEIFNGYHAPGTDYYRLQQAEWNLDDETGRTLDGIDLGALKDPSWFESLVGAIGSFVGGILESIANLLEAFITGDWATFFWELRNLLNAAILILGTIALFTGVGAPLFFLSLAAFAVTAGLAITQTPNPQTGETLGAGDVVLSAVGVVFSAGGAIRAFQPGGSGMRLFTGNRVVQTRPHGFIGPMPLGGPASSLFSTVRNVRNLRLLNSGGPSGHLASRALNIRNWGRHRAPSFTSTYVLSGSGLYTTGRVAWGVRGQVATIQNWTDISLGPLDTITGATGHAGIANRSGGFHGFNNAHGINGWAVLDGAASISMGRAPGVFGQAGTPGEQGTPLFGPAATPAATNQVISQMQASPEVHVVQAAPCGS